MPFSEEVIQKTSEVSSDFRDLMSEHKGYNKRVEKIEKKGHLLAEDEEELKKLKLLKLAVKDKMEKIIGENAGA
ncbi:MAG: DUF465 domain-containing protein [Deltaproteobacteria bacterium]|nr:DUF465 domain-containing protein [Deltaproteobacteria bacterium]